jgi:phosphoglycerol transferase
VLFALAPYHFLRSEYHFFLAATFPIPLGAYLVLAIYLGRPLFARRDGGSRWLRFVTPRTLATLAICIAVGLSDFYYAAFTALLTAMATVIAAAARRELRTLLAGGVVTVALVLVTALILTPTFVYRAEHGKNAVLTRAPSESQQFSLNVIALVLPVEDHRLGPLASIRDRYQRSTTVAKEPAPLGLLASIGFAWLLAVALAFCLGVAGRFAPDPRHRSLATANLTVLLLGTTGGISAIIAYAISPELRTWSRLSVYIAFFAVAALCLLADSARPWFERRGSRARGLGLAALAVIVVLAVLDQTSPPMTPDYSEVAAEYHSDGAFVQRIEQTVGPDAEIFQLPYMNFPDQLEFARLQDYDAARGYLHSDDLRWSYGAMKGRSRDWQSETVNLPLSLVVPMVSAARFKGIYLDRYGYTDNGTAVDAQLRQILGAQPFPSPNGRLEFFDMRAYNARFRSDHPRAQLAALAAVTLRPLQTVWSKDSFNTETRDGGSSTRWTADPRSRLEVLNPSSGPRVAALAMTLARPSGAAAGVVLRLPGGVERRIQVQPQGTPVVVAGLRFPPGKSTIEIDTAAPPVAKGVGSDVAGYLQLQGFRLIPREAVAATASP